MRFFLGLIFLIMTSSYPWKVNDFSNNEFCKNKCFSREICLEKQTLIMIGKIILQPPAIIFLEGRKLSSNLFPHLGKINLTPLSRNRTVQSSYFVTRQNKQTQTRCKENMKTANCVIKLLSCLVKRGCPTVNHLQPGRKRRSRDRWAVKSCYA